MWGEERKSKVPFSVMHQRKLFGENCIYICRQGSSIYKYTYKGTPSSLDIIRSNCGVHVTSYVSLHFYKFFSKGMRPSYFTLAVPVAPNSLSPRFRINFIDEKNDQNKRKIFDLGNVAAEVLQNSKLQIHQDSRFDFLQLVFCHW